jgi:hypothetical protein
VSEPALESPVWVLQVKTVQQAVRRLIGRPTHEFYPGYLHLRQQAARGGGLHHVRPEWTQLGHLLEVPGAPPTKPYLKPFKSTSREDRYYWWNSNIPGSYAPSSLRPVPLKVVGVNADGTYTLPPDHAERALEHLLFGTPLAATDVAAFLLRDHGFVATTEPTADDLVDVFRREFGLADDDEFATVYTVDADDFEAVGFELLAERGDRRG